MKTLLILILLLSFQLSAQHSSLDIKCLNYDTRQPLVNYLIELHWTDSLKVANSTNEEGRVHFEGLPHGDIRFLITKRGVQDSIIGYSFLQEGQLAVIEISLDSALSYSKTDEENIFFTLDKKGQEASIPIHGSLILSDGNLPVMELQCCVLSVRAQIDQNRIMAADMAKVSAYCINGVAFETHERSLSSSVFDTRIRGSREGSTAFYIDGIRVRESGAIPRSTYRSVTVLTGGIPAKYGDLTGGVVSVETKSYFDLFRNYEQSLLYNSYSSRNRCVPDMMNRPPAHIHEQNFAPLYENTFQAVSEHPFSTFGLDVDRASWAYIKRSFVSTGSFSRNAVKLEEMINSFDLSDSTAANNEEPVQIEVKRNVCSWNEQHELVTIHLNTMELPVNDERKAHNLVFLIDVSGSMSGEDRLPLLVSGLKEFVRDLNEKDRVSIVTYAGYSGTTLQSTTCDQKKRILSALDSLQSGGSTNGIGGITEAYRLAELNFDSTMNNRIILATDGDFNVGISSSSELEDYIATKRGQQIYLTALGFGMDNYRNYVLESLADKGDGNHFYIRDMEDMRNVLNNLGNLMTIARDVKLNVEFNPEQVVSYRLLGYENRLLNTADFKDDDKDGGELGYGHKVTAVYEIERKIDAQSTASDSVIATVSLRYKPFSNNESIERQTLLTNAVSVENNRLLNLVASLGLYLRNSPYKGSADQRSIYRLASMYSPRNPEEVELKKIAMNL